MAAKCAILRHPSLAQVLSESFSPLRSSTFTQNAHTFLHTLFQSYSSYYANFPLENFLSSLFIQRGLNDHDVFFCPLTKDSFCFHSLSACARARACVRTECIFAIVLSKHRAQAQTTVQRINMNFFHMVKTVSQELNCFYRVDRVKLHPAMTLTRTPRSAIGIFSIMFESTLDQCLFIRDALLKTTSWDGPS